MSKIVIEASNSLEDDDVTVLTFKRSDGGEDSFPLPKPLSLEADLFDLMRTGTVITFMPALLTRHAPELASRLRLSQMSEVWAAYIGDEDVAPGESEASPVS